MSGEGLEANALLKLIKVARARADEVAVRIEALRAALVANDASLGMLDATVLEESTAARAAEMVGFTQLAGFLVGADKKRAILKETQERLIGEIRSAEADLRAAYCELKKLEHVADRARVHADRRRRRREGADLDDAARLGAIRRRAR